MFCFFVTVEGYQYFSGIGNIGKTQDFHWSRRSGLFYPASFVIHHRADFTGRCTCGDEITHMKGTFLNQDGSHRSFSFVQLCLDDHTSGGTVRICFQLTHFRGQKNHLQKIIDSFSRVSGNRHEDGASAPVLRNQLIL